MSIFKDRTVVLSLIVAATVVLISALITIGTTIQKSDAELCFDRGMSWVPVAKFWATENREGVVYGCVRSDTPVNPALATASPQHH